MAVSIFKDEYIVRVYQLARGGLTEKKIAKVLGISVATFRVWEKKKKYFKLMLEAGRKAWGGKDEKETTIQDYIFQSLPRNLRRLWNEINALEKAKSGVEKIEALLQKRGVRARQSIFLHAWTKGNFSLTRALRKVNISRSTFDAWCTKDPGFAQLVSDIDWYKGNFYEDAFVGLVKGGDTSAIIHAQKTFNRKRGYGEKTDIDINLSGGVSISHTVEGKGLSLATRKAILEDMRNGKKEEKTKANKT